MGVKIAVAPKCNFCGGKNHYVFGISGKDNRYSSIRLDFCAFFIVKYLSLSICGVPLWHFTAFKLVSVKDSY